MGVVGVKIADSLRGFLYRQKTRMNHNRVHKNDEMVENQSSFGDTRFVDLCH